MKRNFLLLCICFSLVLSFFGNFMPYAKASLTGDNFITEITTAPSAIDLVDVDSEGRLFAVADNDIYRSLDNGVSWTKVKDNPALTGIDYCIFIDSNDYVFAGTETASHYFAIQRSTDHGDTWTDEISEIPKPWEMDEMTNGTLLVNTYYTGSNWIYQSHDNGDTWSVFYNFTANGWNIDHIHAVGIDDNNDDVYIVTGDGQDQSGVWRWNGASWDEIANSTLSTVTWQFTKVMFDSTYVYFLADGQYKNYRMLRTGTSSDDFRAIHDIRWGGQASTNFVWAWYVNDADDVYLFGTDEGQIWGSWDGEHWVKVYDIGNGNTFLQFTHRKPIFVSEYENDKLYRVDIAKEDIVQLYYAQHNQYRGSLTNAQNYVLQQRIWNGTNYIDLTQVALQNVQASIIGLSRINQAPTDNSGFEWNNKTGWYENGAPAGTITSAEKANGTYSYKIVKGTTDAWAMLLYRDAYISGSQGDIYILSFWWKANASVATALEVYLYNGSNVDDYMHFTSPTSWTRYTMFYALPSTSTQEQWRIKFEKANVTHYLDSVVMYKLEVGMARWQASGESFTNFESFATVVGDKNTENINEGYNPIAYHDGSLNTLNPTLVIDSQSVSYSGTLTNGTESSATSLTGILTGAVEVDANIQGSGQAILNISGTRILYEDSIILEGRTSGVYYGRYYGTFSPTTTTNDLVAVTTLSGDITTLSFSSDKLTLTIDAASTTTSTTQIYCGNNGEPTFITGATSWSYNSGTNMATINVLHSSAEQVEVGFGVSGVLTDAAVAGAQIFSIVVIMGMLYTTLKVEEWKKRLIIVIGGLLLLILTLTFAVVVTNL